MESKIKERMGDIERIPTRTDVMEAGKRYVRTQEDLNGFLKVARSIELTMPETMPFMQENFINGAIKQLNLPKVSGVGYSCIEGLSVEPGGCFGVCVIKCRYKGCYVHVYTIDGGVDGAVVAADIFEDELIDNIGQVEAIPGLITK